MRVVRLLVGNPPQTIAQLIRATGVTRTAVSEQLNELVAGGFAARTMERLPGRGRPRYLYSATQAALLLLFAKNQHLVVPSIWKAIDQVGGRELTRKVLKRVTHAVADHYRPRVTGRSARERFRQVAELWSEEGHLVEVHENEKGHLVLRKRSCGFISMFEETRTICGVDMDVIAALVQAPIRRVEYRHEGHPCCAFELCSANGK
jgi:predicted ArsR family transcriptional regulator